MIPLDKGHVPVDALGVAINVTGYQQWRTHLIDRIGNYCSYCNVEIAHSLQIEHVQPIHPLITNNTNLGKELAWDNVILACGPCNRAKWNTPIDDGYYLPTVHNTLKVFRTEYQGGHGLIRPKYGITHEQSIKANSTINLLELDNIDQRAAIIDIRSRIRHEKFIGYSALLMAFLGTDQSQAQAENIATVASRLGCFLIAFEVFAPYPILVVALRDKIKGFRKAAINDNGEFIPLNIGLADPV